MLAFHLNFYLMVNHGTKDALYIIAVSIATRFQTFSLCIFGHLLIYHHSHVDTMEEAEKFRNRRRKVIRDRARVHEQPVPLLVLVKPNDILNISTSSGEVSLNHTTSNYVEDDPLEGLDNSLPVGATGQHSDSLENNANDSLVQSAPASLVSLIQMPYSNRPTEPLASDNANDSLGGNENNATMVDLTFESSPENVGATADIQTPTTLSKSLDQLNISGNQANIKKEPFAALAEADLNAAENIFSSSFENCVEGDDDVMVCRRDETPRPKYDTFELDFGVKKFDILSGNIPFAENVSNFD